MSFAADNETQLTLDSLDEFIEQEAILEELGDTYTNPRKGNHDDARWTDELLEAREEIRRRSAEAGFYAMNLPESVGGEDVSPVTWYRAKKHLMADVVASLSQSVAYQAATGDPAEPRPGETALTGGVPWYDSYETADGQWVTLAALEPKFWQAFCEAVGRDDLVDEHDTSDPDVLAALEELFRERTRDEWEQALGDVDAAFAGVYSPAEIFDHPQFRARDLIERPEDAPPRIGFPARSSDGLPAAEEGIPAQGEHTRSISPRRGTTTVRSSRFSSPAP